MPHDILCLLAKFEPSIVICQVSALARSIGTHMHAGLYHGSLLYMLFAKELEVPLSDSMNGKKKKK